MVEYREKRSVKCQHSVSSLSFVLSSLFLVDSSTKPQEKMPLALIKKAAAYEVLLDIYNIYIQVIQCYP